MHTLGRYHPFAAGCALLVLFGSGVAAQQRQGSADPADTVRTADERAALDALQRARVALATVVEHSLPQEAREALQPINDGYRELYRSYTGEAPDARETAAQAVPSAQSNVDRDELRRAYVRIESGLSRMIGPPSSDENAPVGTSGASAKTPMAGIPDAVQQDLRKLRAELRQFYRAATGEAPPAASDQSDAKSR
ncbi:MAG: hypothetical protein AB7N65_14480 [Vicinamibacterales bacterium]